MVDLKPSNPHPPIIVILIGAGSCSDCGMEHEELYSFASASPKCVSCMEARIGKRINWTVVVDYKLP